MQAWDHVDDIGEDGAHHECVGGGCARIRELDVELAVVVDNPSTYAGAGYGVCRAGQNAVEADNVVGAEDCIRHEADHATDGVFGEDVHSVVDFDPVFDCSKHVSSVRLRLEEVDECIPLVAKLHTI